MFHVGNKPHLSLRMDLVEVQLDPGDPRYLALIAEQISILIITAHMIPANAAYINVSRKAIERLTGRTLA